MKTLVFCTSYAAERRSWDDRQAVWIRALQRSALHFDQLLIVDDGSAVLPSWPDVAIVRENEVARPEELQSDAPILLYTHEARLGRQSVFEFPGWYRSFAFGVLYGATHGFEKIIHLESDAFLVSDRIQRYFNEFTTGWFSVWCQAYLFPEIAIQAAAGDQVEAMAAFVREPYSQMAGRIHEYLFPFTHIERSFVGNRYGEMIGHVPRHADYSAQTHTAQSDDFYWWIPREGGSASPREAVTVIKAPVPADMLEGGWSVGERQLNWMLDLDSSLIVPPVAAGGAFDLELDLFPCLFADRTQQRIFILVNDRLVNTVTLYRRVRILSLVAPGTLFDDRPNVIRFLHPDAFAPSEIGAHTETRRLSIALVECALYRRSDLPPDPKIA